MDLSAYRAGWRAAITLGNNIAVQESDRFNADDQTSEAVALANTARRIRDWHDPPDDQLEELLIEAGELQPRTGHHCTCCGVNSVSPENGEDTCAECLRNV